MTAENDPTISIVHSARELRDQIDAWSQADLSIALVPTMGALHKGHLSLVHLALENADRAVVSIFVNPTQFGPTEDFARYPRQLENDLEKLRATGAHLVYAPDLSEVYPDNFSTTVSVSEVSEGLCGTARPGHFDGVATIVAKLLMRCLPDVAIFGEKDYQQLLVIKRMVRDLDIPVDIIGGEIQRETDGLAISSRNFYLSAQERQIAAHLNKVLTQTGDDIVRGVNIIDALTQGTQALLAAGFDKVDYVELRDAENLAPLSELNRPARLLAAAWLGKTRLIDNRPVAPGV